MPESRDSRWLLRLLTEGVVVVLSILAAFALDAWWGERQADRSLAQDLAGVRVELEQNRDLISYQIDALGRILSGSEALLATMDGSADQPTVAVPDTIAFLITVWAPTLDASFGAIDALITSGRLAEVEDPHLRSGLAALRDRVADAVEDQVVALNILNEQVFPLLATEFDMKPITRLDLEFFSHDRVEGLPIPTYGNVQLPNTLAIRNTIRFRIGWIGSAMAGMRRLSVYFAELSDRTPVVD